MMENKQIVKREKRIPFSETIRSLALSFAVVFGLGTGVALESQLTEPKKIELPNVKGGIKVLPIKTEIYDRELRDFKPNNRELDSLLNDFLTSPNLEGQVAFFGGIKFQVLNSKYPNLGEILENYMHSVLYTDPKTKTRILKEYETALLNYLRVKIPAKTNPEFDAKK